MIRGVHPSKKEVQIWVKGKETLSEWTGTTHPVQEDTTRKFHGTLWRKITDNGNRQSVNKNRETNYNYRQIGWCVVRGLNILNIQKSKNIGTSGRALPLGYLRTSYLRVIYCDEML